MEINRCEIINKSGFQMSGHFRLARSTNSSSGNEGGANHPGVWIDYAQYCSDISPLLHRSYISPVHLTGPQHQLRLVLSAKYFSSCLTSKSDTCLLTSEFSLRIAPMPEICQHRGSLRFIFTFTETRLTLRYTQKMAHLRTTNSLDGPKLMKKGCASRPFKPQLYTSLHKIA